MIASNEKDGSQDVKRIPIVGGPLHDGKAPRTSEQPLMSMAVQTPNADECIRMLFKYDTGAWHWRGWGDHTGELMAAADTDECVRITDQLGQMLDPFKKAVGIDPKASPILMPSDWQAEMADDVERKVRDGR